MTPNHTLEKLHSGGVALGCFLRYADAGLAEFLALNGVDFLVFDGEHGTLSPSRCEHLVRSAELHGVTPLVRVENRTPSTLLRYLDTGALGCHVPNVANRDDAVAAVRALKYFPEGERGLSACRASGYGASSGYGTYVRTANERTQLVVQIESAAGVAEAEAIAAVDGVDVLLVGTLDLSQDLGFPGDVARPEIQDALSHVAQSAKRHGKVVGSVVTSPRDAERRIEQGSRYIVSAVESLIRPAVREFALAGQPEATRASSTRL